MTTTPVAPQWETHRHPRSVYGPQGISYYSADVTPTEYLTVTKEGSNCWRWSIFTIRRHNTFGRAQQLDTGIARTLTRAKVDALIEWRAR